MNEADALRIVMLRAAVRTLSRHSTLSLRDASLLIFACDNDLAEVARRYVAAQELNMDPLEFSCAELEASRSK